MNGLAELRAKRSSRKYLINPRCWRSSRVKPTPLINIGFATNVLPLPIIHKTAYVGSVAKKSASCRSNLDTTPHSRDLMRLQGMIAPVLAVLLGPWLSGSAAAEIVVKPASQGYDVDVNGPASVTEVIDAIAKAAGAEVKGAPQDATVSANHLRNTSLERALRILLPRTPFAVRYDENDFPTSIVFLAPSTDSMSNGDYSGDGGTGSGSEADQTDQAEPDTETDTTDTGN